MVMQRANQRTRLKENKTITKKSQKIINRQIQFMAHHLRAKEDDIINTCTVNCIGFRISAGFKRTGRPRIKWYDQVMNSCFNRLVTMGLLLPNWREYIRIDEAKQIALQTATDRELQKKRLRPRKRQGSGLANDLAPATQNKREHHLLTGSHIR